MSTTNSLGEDDSVSSEKLKRIIARQYNNIDAWLYAFPTPSDFLQFFDKKLITMETQFDRIMELVNEYKIIADKGIKLEDTASYLSSRVYELEENLHDSQTCLYEERENYVKLATDNELLKLENEDFRRKFQAVLLMSKIDERDVTLFMQKNPRAAVLTDQMIQIKDEIRKCQGPKKNKYELLNPVVLVKQVHVLEDHIKNLSALHLEKESAFKEQLKLIKDEKKNQHEEYQDRLQRTVNCGIEAKNLVHSLVLENVSAGHNLISAEQSWIKERDQLLKLVTQSHVETLKSTTASNCLTKKRVSDNDSSDAIIRRLTQKQSRLELQIMEKENLIEDYKIKQIRLEKQIFQLEEIREEIKKIHRDDVRKLTEKYRTVEKRCDEIDARRKMDNAGFREDIRGVKILLTAIERKIRVLASSNRKKSSLARCTDANLPKMIQESRAVTAPGNFAHSAQPEPEPEATEHQNQHLKEGLTWEALNHLLAIASERVNQLEQRVKIGYRSVKC